MLSQDNLLTSYEKFLKIAVQKSVIAKRKSQLASYCFSESQNLLAEDFTHLLTDFSDGYYSSSNSDELLSVGNIVSISAEGADRWQAIEKQYSEFPKPFFNTEERQFVESPLFLTAVKFSEEKRSIEWMDFKNIEFYVPKFLILYKNNSLLFRFNALLDSAFSVESSILEFANILKQVLGENHVSKKRSANILKRVILPTNDKEKWNRNVEKALSEIKNNSLTKVVLARRISLTIDSQNYVEELLVRLKKNNPAANIFLIKKNNSVFFGASPEILIELNENTLRTEAIAGSRKRGLTLHEDVQLENELLNSSKELHEQRSVLEFLLDNLNSVSSHVAFNETPRVKKLSSIQHLSTTITAKLKNGSSFFTILGNIFPTPAVCGFPKQNAKELISQLEDFDRGLYAGLVGWVSPASAKLIVAIRSALINKKTIFAYAGCGIVDGSNPANEFAETETKFKTILSVLHEEN